MNTLTIRTSRDWQRLAPKGYLREQPEVGVGEPVVPVALPRNRVLRGDAHKRLRELPNRSIDCVVTSVPYFLLRDYDIEGQIGLESTVEEWVDALRPIFSEVARVLKPGGALWLNVADTYSHASTSGAPPKSMLLAPERLLLALSDDGWIVRSKVIWAKPNAMPNGVADRLNTTYEPLYFLVRSPRYYFDLDAIREEITPSAADVARAVPLGAEGPLKDAAASENSPLLGTNPGDVWPIATKAFRGAHLATFPPELVRRPILATCPERICTKCGGPQRRSIATWRIPLGSNGVGPKPRDRFVMRFTDRWHTVRQSGELAGCGCNAPTVPGVVLDPFFGAGTSGLVAQQCGRDWIGIELSDDYTDLAEARIDAARHGP